MANNNIHLSSKKTEHLVSLSDFLQDLMFHPRILREFKAYAIKNKEKDIFTLLTDFFPDLDLKDIPKFIKKKESIIGDDLREKILSMTVPGLIEVLCESYDLPSWIADAICWLATTYLI